MNSITIPSKITSELAEETGWHIGDGSMNFYKNGNNLKGIYQLRGHIRDDKNHYQIRIEPIFKKLYNYQVNLREMPSTKVYGFQIWNDEIVKYKQQLGLPLGKKWAVKIPEIFLETVKYKKAIVRGIFDTDGCISLNKKRNLYPHILISTISYPLASQLLEILRDMKLRANLYISKPNLEQVRPNAIYKVEIVGREQTKKFFDKISPQNPKHLGKYYLHENVYKSSRLNDFCGAVA